MKINAKSGEQVTYKLVFFSLTQVPGIPNKVPMIQSSGPRDPSKLRRILIPTKANYRLSVIR